MDIPQAKALTEEQIKEHIKTLKTEQKYAHTIENITFDIKSLITEINRILKSSIEPTKNIERLTDEDAIAFAKKGLELHSPGDRCFFCGNIVEESTLNDLKLYFNAEQITNFNQKVDNKQREINNLKEKLLTLKIDSDNFYPKYTSSIKDIELKIKLATNTLSIFLTSISNVLQKKLVNPFSTMDSIALEADLLSSSNTISLELKHYNEICKTNNDDDLKKQIENAKQELRLHLVWKAIEGNPKYRETLDDINKLKLEKQQISEMIDPAKNYSN